MIDDLTLPEWGPYGKRYAGTSHVADAARGGRFDLTVALGLFRGRVTVPDALFAVPVHPWSAAPDLSNYSYRYELDDAVRAEVAFTSLPSAGRLISCTIVNDGPVDQRVVAHALASVDFARIGSHREWLRTVTVAAPDGVRWIDALDHHRLQWEAGRRTAGLMPDGLLRGEQRAHDAVGGSVLGAGFGAAPGDHASYRTAVVPLDNGTLRVRLRAEAGTTVRLRLSGSVLGTVVVTGTGSMVTADLPVGRRPGGTFEFTLATDGGQPCEIDGFLVGEHEQVSRASFVTDPLAPRLGATPGPAPRSMIVTHPAFEQVYGVAWNDTETAMSRFVGHDLDRLLNGGRRDGVGTPRPSPLDRLQGVDAIEFADLLTRPIAVAAGATVTIHGIVCHGSDVEVASALAGPPSTASRQSGIRHDGYDPGSVNPSGQRHIASQERMAATVLTNVVYPTYRRRRHVRHQTPGRWWDSLYTWDSGFIALGLAELAPQRSAEVLEMYLTEVGDPHSAFIHHGSPVPVQPYVAAELINRGADPRRWYPQLRQQYDFLIGRHPQSRTWMASGLLNTFDLFYNSGGWDDYPAQVHLHERGLTTRGAPMVTASHAIRVAKLLTLAAVQVGDREAISTFTDDVARIGAAVQQCWDPVAGYFGYGLHDDEGALTGVLRADDGSNLNMGLDGASPLVAGICDEEQRAALLTHLFSATHLWSDVGLSTVDQSASYFSLDGYWNGSVWMAHQWFFFKAMLDLGRPDLARRIASTALEVWTRETDRTHRCWEHFSVATGRGGGWHAFGGLSAPVLNFFAALHRPGNLTCGLDTWALDRQFSPARDGVRARLFTVPGRTTDVASIIACLQPGRNYRAQIDGEPIDCDGVDDGVVHLTWMPGARARDQELLITST